MHAHLRVRRDSLEAPELRIPLDDVRRIVVIGGGKAGAGMSRAVEAILGDAVLREKAVRGWVNVPNASLQTLRRVQLHGARRGHHNLPSREGLIGTRHIAALLEEVGRDDVVVALISGGGSSLLPAPARGVSLSEKRKIVERLQASGATIREVNAVRKHLSRVKGGGWARGFRGRRLIAFLLSDVIGDRPDVIASGPTAPDPTTFSDAIAVLRRYRLWAGAPAAVRTCLKEGAAGQRPETLKRTPSRVSNILIGGNSTALEAARRAAKGLGYHVHVERSPLAGEARQAGSRLARRAQQLARGSGPVKLPACVLAGGETTVTLGKNPGVGGRNQEVALAALEELRRSGMAGLAVLCGGTDGEDGPTDAAGAIADEGLLARAGREGLDPTDFLTRHDSYNFFDPLGGLIRTGLTGTNVMDLAVVLVGKPEAARRRGG